MLFLCFEPKLALSEQTFFIAMKSYKELSRARKPECTTNQKFLEKRQSYWMLSKMRHSDWSCLLHSEPWNWVLLHCTYKKFFEPFNREKSKWPFSTIANFLVVNWREWVWRCMWRVFQSSRALWNVFLMLVKSNGLNKVNLRFRNVKIEWPCCFIAATTWQFATIATFIRHLNELLVTPLFNHHEENE